MATFPALGVDGLSGIGVTMTFAAGRYDGLTHMHVLLDNPRAGVMQVIAFEPGDTTPEPWVFADVENYITWNWNVRTSFNVIRSLVDRFQYEGATDKFVAEKISEQFGHRFRDGDDRQHRRAIRLDRSASRSRPASAASKARSRVKVVDEEQARKTLLKFVEKYPDRFEERAIWRRHLLRVRHRMAGRVARRPAEHAVRGGDGRLLFLGRIVPVVRAGDRGPRRHRRATRRSARISCSWRPRCSRKRRA